MTLKLFVFLFLCCSLSSEAYRSGDKITASNGETYTLGRRLGKGTTTKIYEIIEDKALALRVPLSEDLSAFLTFTVRGDAMLEAGHVPKVKIIDYQNLAYAEDGQTPIQVTWVLVERLHFKYTLEDFLKNPLRWSLRERMRMVRALARFVKKTANFIHIGDLRPRQLAWVPSRGWVLLDWTEQHAQNTSDYTSLFTILDSLLDVYNSKLIFHPRRKIYTQRLYKLMGKVLHKERNVLYLNPVNSPIGSSCEKKAESSVILIDDEV